MIKTYHMVVLKRSQPHQFHPSFETRSSVSLVSIQDQVQLAKNEQRNAQYPAMP